MRTTKVAITIDPVILARLDRLVKQKVFPSRSKAIQEAIHDKLAHMERSRLAIECAKLDPKVEQAFAEEGMSQELAEWPEY
jgi:metal-responsive CopG/Arc/MetJ family transcriptional regulator